MNTLSQLHAEIEARVTSIREDHKDWLCRKGCDSCCRRLAAIPRLTAAEWEYLREGLAELPATQLQAISQDIAELQNHPASPLICPLLDQTAGACLLYNHRPLACRTYGFYVQRGVGLYCQDIEVRVAAGEWATVVWGNQDALDRRVSGCGTVRALTEWFLDPAEGLPEEGR